GASHVQNHPGKGKVFGDVNGALQLVHGFDAPHTFDLRDGERSAAFAIGAEVAACGRVEGSELQAIVGQNMRQAADVLRNGVIEMATARKEINSLETRAMNQRQKLRRQLLGYKEVGRKDSLHALQFSAEEELAQSDLGSGVSDEASGSFWLVADGGTVVARVGSAAAFAGLGVNSDGVDQADVALAFHRVPARFHLLFLFRRKEFFH